MKKLLPFFLLLAVALATSIGGAAPAITATKTDALVVDGNGNGKADPGDTLQYTVTIQNNGPGNANGVNFSDTLDANTTFVNVLPVARNDSYTTIGNTLLEVGVTPSGNPAVKVSGNVLQNDLDFMDTLTVTSYGGTSANGGSVTMSPNGTFSFLPAVNFNGTDSFTYTIQDSQGESSTATVTINVQDRVWYVNNSGGGSPDGRSSSPFNNLAAAQAASSAGDIIFVHQGSASYGGGITLKNNQQLIGQGVDLVVGGFTLVTKTSNPTLSNASGNGITVANGNTIAGVTVSGCADNGLFGNNVTGLTIEACTVSNNGDSAALDEAGVKLINLIGIATITNTTVFGSIENNLTVANTAGTLTALTIANSTFRDNHATSGGDGVAIDASGTANMTVIITGGTFTANRQDHFKANARDNALLDVTFGGSGALKNTLTGGHPNALGQDILLSSANSATLTFDILGNEINGATLSAINLFQANTSTVGAGLSGTISGNTIGTTGVAGSGSSTSSGISITASGLGTETLVISGNSIRQYSNHGIVLTAGDTSPTLNVSITGNTIKEPNGTFAQNGIHLNAGTTVAGAANVCLDLGGTGAAENDFVGAGNTAGGFTDFRLRQRNGSTVRLPGYLSGSTDTAAVIAYIQGRNIGTPTGTASTQAPGGGFVGGAACTQPLMAAASGLETAKQSAQSVTVVGQSECQPEPGSAAKATNRSSPVVLTDSALSSIVDAAIIRWTCLGLREDQAAALCNTVFRVAHLPGSYLAESSPGLVRIDADASGYGWFIDSTPLDDCEFSNTPSSVRLYSSPDDAPAGRIDLLTTVMHELGHAIGIADTYSVAARDSLMYGLLITGERRLPVAGIAEGAVPGSIIETHFQATAINLPIGTLAAGESITIKIRVQINNPFPTTVCQVSNQGTVSGSNFSDVLTDDPDTVAANDPTITHVDATPPTITCPPNVTVNTDAGQCSATVNPGTATATDNCAGVTVAGVRSDSQPLNAAYPKGTTTITWTATDGVNLTATCTQTVTVVDNQAPLINCSTNQVIVPAAGQCTAAATYTVTATDNCPGTVTVTCNPPSGSTFSSGVTTVNCTATDVATNQSSCSFTVTVLGSLTVVFEPPLSGGTNVANEFTAGQIVLHKVKLLDCQSNDVTASVASSVTVRLNVTERDTVNTSFVVDVPETFMGVGGPGGLMVLSGDTFQYNLQTTGYDPGTVNNTHFFDSRVTVTYNSNPTVVVGEAVAILESR